MSKKIKFDIKKIKDVKNLGVKFGEGYDKIQSNVPLMICTCIAAFVVMGLVCLVVFLSNVKGPEQVLVPNVQGKQLEEALLELQVKELYPKISLRYSEIPGDKGSIIEQSPKAGAIVKGYSRVSLVVSRGVVADEVGDYVGKTFDEVQLNLQTLFAGQTKPLIVLADPEYIPSVEDAGKILEQNPLPGTKITEPVTVQLVVSRGASFENTRAPWVVGQSVNDFLQTIARTKVVFDIESHIAEEGEVAGTVVSQDQIEEEFIPNYSHVGVQMAMPSEPINDNVYGIFTAQLSVYPFPVAMRLEAVPAEGATYTILNFNHPGGNLSIPYAVPAGTTLVLTVVDKVEARKLVN